MTVRPVARRVLPPMLLAALLLAGCGHAADDAGDAPVAAGAVPVRTLAVGMREFRHTVTATGQWRSAGEVVLAAPFAAWVESLRVAPGDAVVSGQRIGVLVTRDSRAAVLGAEQLMATATDAPSRSEAASALAQARRDLVRVPLRASGAGTVVRRSAAPGADVAEGAELVALVPAGSLVFEAHVPLAVADGVRPGMTADVRGEGVEVVRAVVQRRLPQASAADQSALFWLAPGRPPGAGSLDRFATATLDLGGAHRAIAVPDSALVEDDLTGTTRLAHVERGVATWLDVRVGEGQGGWHELLAPTLRAGALVIVRGQRGLPDSARVTAAP